MTATLEQIQSELAKHIALAQQGEEIKIMSGGHVVATLTGVQPRSDKDDLHPWLEDLAALRSRTMAGGDSRGSEQILDDLRSERN